MIKNIKTFRCFVCFGLIFFMMSSCSDGGRGVRFTPFNFNSERPIDGFWKTDDIKIPALGPFAGKCLRRHVKTEGDVNSILNGSTSSEVYTVHDDLTIGGNPPCTTFDETDKSVKAQDTDGFGSSFIAYIGNDYYYTSYVEKIDVVGIPENFYILATIVDKDGPNEYAWKSLYFVDENKNYSDGYILMGEVVAHHGDSWANILAHESNNAPEINTFINHFSAPNFSGKPVGPTVYKFIRSADVF